MKSKYNKNDLVIFSVRGIMYAGFIKEFTEYEKFETKYLIESGFKVFSLPESSLAKVKIDEPKIFESFEDPYEDGGL